MSMPQLELRILKKIPAKYLAPNRIYDGDPPGLERAYGAAMGLRDPWHAGLEIRSRYATMSELKNVLAIEYPEADFSSWSATGGTEGRDVSVLTANGMTIRVPYERYEAMKTEHIDTAVFECQVQSWSLDLPSGDRDWLECLLPRYVDPHVIADLARMRYEYARKSSREARTDRISMAGWSGAQAPDVIGFVADGLAEARAARCALYACLVD